MEDWRGLRMESGDVAYLAPPFPADPHALGTTLLEGGEDDEDIYTVWYTRTAYDMHDLV